MPKSIAAIGAALALFLVLAVLVHLRLLAGIDLAFALAAQTLAGPLLDGIATASGILLAAQMSLLYGLAGCLLLWRARLGLWALAPLAFLPGTVLEVVLKLTVDQPGVPHDFHRQRFYPFALVDLPGAFPSGHALRTAFFCTFLAVIMWSKGGIGWRIGSVALGVLALTFGFTRAYVGDHWISDVVAGLLLGSASALLVAPSVALRLRESGQ